MKPEDLVGKEVPAADGGDYGHRIIRFDVENDDYIVRPVKWSTGTFLSEHTHDIARFKISYRYQLDKAREPLLP